jgi:hypothetical protein
LQTVFGDFGLALVQRLQGFKTYLGLTENAPIMEMFHKLDSIRKKAEKKKTTLQKWLYRLKDKCQLKALHEEIKEEDESLVEYFNWRQVSNKSASMWLTAQCKRREFLMTNTEFCVALCLRYHKKIPFIDVKDRDCPCCKKKGCIDLHGHHFISGCLKDVPSKFRQGKQIHSAHDQLRYALYRLAKHANTRCIQEPVNWLFAPETNNVLKPDLQVSLAPSTENIEVQHFAIDLSFVCPFQGSQSGNISIVANKITDHERIPKAQIDLAATNRFKAKVKKYGKAAENAKVKFVPFIVNTTGKIHDDGVKFLETLAQHAAQTRNEVDHGPFLSYYMKVMSVEIMKLMANLMYSKSIACFSRNTRDARIHLREGNKAVFSEWNPPRPCARLSIGADD